MRHVLRVRVAFVVSFLALLTVARPAAAQNLLTNPHFDVDASGWTLSPGATFDAAADANASPASGSVRGPVVAQPAFSNQFDGILGPCIAGISPLTTYDYGGKIFVDAAPAGGGGRFAISYYSDAGCATPIVADATAIVTTTGSWQSATTSSFSPINALAVRFTTNSGTGANAGDIVFHVDDVFFQAETPVPSMGFGLTIALALMLGVAGALALRRRQLSA